MPTNAHEIISIIAPFASGALGVGIAWATLRQRVNDIDRRITRAEDRLECQVGEARCREMREECKKGVSDVVARLETTLMADKEWMTERFLEISRYMGQHNGHATRERPNGR